jgi:hypothetical protein
MTNLDAFEISNRLFKKSVFHATRNLRDRRTLRRTLYNWRRYLEAGLGWWGRITGRTNTVYGNFVSLIGFYVFWCPSPLLQI